MKKVAIYSFLGFVLIGCSGKDLLKGERKDLVFSEVQNDEKDDVPVTLDQSSLMLGKNPQLLWHVGMQYGNSKSFRMVAPVVIGKGKVFCLDAGGLVYAFDAKTGNRLWRKTTTLKGKDGQIGGAIVYGEGKVIVTSSFAEAFAFDENSGKMLWRIKLPACCKGDGLTVSNGKIYMLCDNSSLQVIDIHDGRLLWSHSGMMTDVTYMGSAGVVIRDEVVYFSYPSGEVFALLSSNGSVLWNAMLSKFSFVRVEDSFSHHRACPVIKDNLIYFTGANRQITAFDVNDGSVVWRKDFGGFESPLISGNSLFVLNSSSELVCMNKDNGKTRWVQNLELRDEEIQGWFGPIQSGDNLLVFASNGLLVEMSARNGHIKSYRKMDNLRQGITARPTILGNMLSFSSDDGLVWAYKLR